MRKLIVSLIILLSCLSYKASAQLDKAYFFYLGRNFIIDNKFQDAIEVLNVLLRVDDRAYEGYFLRGVAKYNLDDLLGAEHDFTVTIDKNPLYTIAYQYRAIVRTRLGNYDDALKDFQEAIDLRPDLAGPYYSRGVTYLLSQQFEKAVEDFTQFLRQENKVADAYINRGISYLYLKDTVSAFDDFNTAIRTNRDNPEGYSRRGTLYMSQKKYEDALNDFNMAITRDSSHLASYFNRAIVYSSTQRPVEAIADFSRVLQLDSVSSLTYFNRAILRSQIGDYNNALKDYDKVAMLSPNNVLVYYNRAGLYGRLGDYPSAINDFSKAIELYPDFANAYLGRSSLRYMVNDMKGSQSDKRVADQKIAEYRSKLNDSTFSVYADTSRRFNQLLSFDTQSQFGSGGQVLDKGNTTAADVKLLPMFRLTFADRTDNESGVKRYHINKLDDFIKSVGDTRLQLLSVENDGRQEEFADLDAALGDSLRLGHSSWQLLFKRGVSQSLIRQYTGSIAAYTGAIDLAPDNPFLYINRSATQSEMIDFISSIDNSYQRISIESDPVNRLSNRAARVYNYDIAIADLDRAAELLPDFAYIYYNRGNLYALSGNMTEAFDDYTRAIKLDPEFGEAYYNRGLVQIYLNDTRKGCLDLSKAGELGVSDAYRLLKIYTNE